MYCHRVMMWREVLTHSSIHCVWRLSRDLLSHSSNHFVCWDVTWYVILSGDCPIRPIIVCGCHVMYLSHSSNHSVWRCHVNTPDGKRGLDNHSHRHLTPKQWTVYSTPTATVQQAQPLDQNSKNVRDPLEIQILHASLGDGTTLELLLSIHFLLQYRFAELMK